MTAGNLEAKSLIYRCTTGSDGYQTVIKILRRSAKAPFFFFFSKKKKNLHRWGYNKIRLLQVHNPFFAKLNSTEHTASSSVILNAKHLCEHSTNYEQSLSNNRLDSGLSATFSVGITMSCSLSGNTLSLYKSSKLPILLCES